MRWQLFDITPQISNIRTSRESVLYKFIALCLLWQVSTGSASMPEQFISNLQLYSVATSGPELQINSSFGTESTTFHEIRLIDTIYPSIWLVHFSSTQDGFRNANLAAAEFKAKIKCGGQNVVDKILMTLPECNNNYSNNTDFKFWHNVGEKDKSFTSV